jgi:DNA-binding transcriptional MocR family regulator
MQLDPYIVEVLMPDLVGHDRSPAAFVVYLRLWSRTHGVGKAAVAVSLQMLVDDTGLSKSAVQLALKHLARRELVRVEKRTPTAVPRYEVRRPWVRAGKGTP